MPLTPEFVDRLRRQFPALSRTVNGKPAIYFDGPAGTQVPQCVIDAISKYLATTNANLGGNFATSIESDQIIESAHRAFADLFNAKTPDEVFFGQNMTTLTFALARSIAKTWQPGDEIVVTRLDHDANVMPWVSAAEERDVKVRYASFRDGDYLLDTDSLHSMLSDKTRLVAVGSASNATGGINPVPEITRMAHDVGALVFVDAVHFVPHGLIDVQDYDCDFLACSAYKFFGPHIGVMWGRMEWLQRLSAYKVRPASDTPPGKWMTGTQSHEAIVGALAAVDYLSAIGRELSENESLPRRESLQVAYSNITVYEADMSRHLLHRLASIRGLKVWGVTDASQIEKRCPTFSITIDSVPPQQIAARLADAGIFVWHGNYYALEFTQSCGLEPEGMVRIGLVHYNTPAEIDRLADELQRLAIAS